MSAEMDEKEIDMKLLSSNIRDMSTRVKLLKFDHMHEQFKLMQYKYDGVEEHMKLLYKDKKDLEERLKEAKDHEKNLEEKLIGFSNEIKNSEKINVDLKKELEKEKKEQMKLQKESDTIMEILRDTNDKCQGNVKIIKSIFSKDKIVLHIINNQIEEVVGKYNEKDRSLKTELKKQNVYLEEFIKLILYMKETFREKELKLQELHNSMKISNLIGGPKKGLDDVLSNSASGKQQQYHALLKIEERMCEIRDRFEDNQTANVKVTLDEMKIKSTKLKEENSSMKNDIFLKMEMIKELREQNDEKAYRLYKNLIDFKKITKEAKKKNEVEESNYDDIDIINSEVQVPDHFNIYEYDEEYNKELNSLSRAIKETGSANNFIKISSNDNNLQELYKELEKLKKEKTQSEKENKRLKVNLDEIIPRYNFLKNEKQKQDFWEMKKSEDPQFREFQKYKQEIRAKNDTIQNLIGVNDELMERVKFFQTERLSILRDKQKCEDLYNYFKEKANKIVLMNEKLSNVVKENQKLKSLLTEFIEKITKINEEADDDLQQSSDLYPQIVSQIQQSFYLILSKGQDFDTSIFNDYFKQKAIEEKEKLRKMKEQEEKEKKNNEENDEFSRFSVEEEKIEAKEEKISEEERENYERMKKLLEEERKRMAEETEEIKKLLSPSKSEDVEKLAELNKILIQNYHLKEQLSVKEKKILDLNKDIINYRKKMKFVKDIEPKIDQMVGENLKLKSIIMQIQTVALENENKNTDNATNFSDHMDVSFQLLDKASHYIRDIFTSKKNLEKRVYVLQSQVNSLEKKRQEERNQKDLEIMSRDHEIKNMKERVKLFEEMEIELKQLRKLKRVLENDLDKSERENDSLKITINLLEKNFKAISENNNKDIETMRKEMNEQKNNINKKFDDESEFLNNKYSLEHRLEKLKDILKAKELVLERKDDNIEKLNDKLMKKQNKLKTMKIEKIDFLKNINNLSAENEVLKSQNKNLEENSNILKERLSNFLNKNSKFLSDERMKLESDIVKNYENQMKIHEQQIKNLEEELVVNRFQDEKKDSLIKELKDKIKMKNKQLVHFNGYLVSMLNGTSSQEMSRFLVQNRDLLKEIEKLRNQKNKIENLYKNLMNSIDKGTVEKDLKKQENLKLKDLRSSFVEDLYANNYNLKLQFDVLDDCYKQKDTDLKTQIASLKNELIVCKNKINVLQADLHEIENSREEITEENSILKEQLNELNKDLSLTKKLLSEVKQRNGILNKEVEEYKMLKLGQNVIAPNLNIENSDNAQELQLLNEELTILKEEQEKEIQDLKTELRELKIQKDNQIEELEKENQTSNDFIKQLKQKIQNPDSETNIMLENDQQLDNLKKMNKELKIDLDIARKNIDSLKERILREQEDKNLLTNFVEKQKKELEVLEIENEQYDEFLSQLQEDLEDNIDQSTKNIIEKYKKNVEELKKKTSELNDEMIKLIQKSKTKNEKYEEIIQDKNTLIEDYEKKFAFLKN